jgi:type VI secretion system secreted protein Hcp
MAYEFYVTIEGATLGVIPGGVTKKGYENSIAGLQFEYAVEVPVAATGQASGKPSRSPVRFVTSWSKASPKLLQALLIGDHLKKVVFKFVRPTATGTEEHFYTITLEQARISRIRKIAQVPVDGLTGVPPELDEISITFNKMIVERKPDAIVVEDVVSSPRSTKGKSR